jgi:hypothetical protein
MLLMMNDTLYQLCWLALLLYSSRVASQFPKISALNIQF